MIAWVVWVQQRLRPAPSSKTSFALLLLYLSAVVVTQSSFKTLIFGYAQLAPSTDFDIKLV